MSRIEQIEEQIKGLSGAELHSFRAWFIEYDAELWDRQIESDLATGKLDDLRRSALDDYATGRTTDL